MHGLVYHGPGKKNWEALPDPSVVEPTDAVLATVSHVVLCGPGRPAFLARVRGAVVDAASVPDAIRAQTPGESAVAVLAEIIAQHKGVRGK